jgi:hypothetical protein
MLWGWRWLRSTAKPEFEMKRFLMGLITAAIAGCASAPATTVGNFGPTPSLNPRIRSVTEGRRGSFTVRVNLSQPAYVAAINVYPNQSAILLGASGLPSGTTKLESGSQSIALQTLATSPVYNAAGWGPADWTRCNSNPYHSGCQQQGYVVIVASQTPFSQDDIATNLAGVDLHGPDSDVIHRIGVAVAHATGDAWSASAGTESAMMAPY